MAKGSYYFLSLHDKSKQRYKDIQEYEPCQIKKEKSSGNISKFPPVQ